MGSFDAHKWFKKQYLEEGHTEDKTREIDRARIEAALEKEPQWEKDSETAEKIRAMLAKERPLREDDLEEIRYPQDDFTQSQLVPRMESMVDRETYKRFVDSLDNLLDDWYMEGFEKDDVLAFMKVIIPSS